MAAVLQAVVDDLRGSVYRHAAGYGSSTDRRRRRLSVVYVARRGRECPFSFENLCDAFSLDPAACETRSEGHARDATRHRRRVPRAERAVAREASCRST
jgi:hypothetical protein